MFDLTLACAADVVRRNQSLYTATRSANGHERRALCIVAGVVCLAVISAALQVAVDGADSPWLGASAELVLACNAALPRAHSLVDQGMCMACTRCD